MVLHFTTTVTATLKTLERRCPKCQHKQVVTGQQGQRKRALRNVWCAGSS